MRIVDEVEALRERLEQLEQGPAVMGDWYRLEARIARALIHAQNELGALQRAMIGHVRAEPPDPRWSGDHVAANGVREQMDELCILRLCVQGRVLELEAEANQRGGNASTDRRL